MKSLRGIVDIINVPPLEKSYTSAFQGGKYNIYPITPENYIEIKDDEPVKIMFVDGGDGSILSGASFDVSILRFAGVEYDGIHDGMNKKIHYAVILTQRQGESFRTEIYDTDLPEDVFRNIEKLNIDIYEKGREKNEFTEVSPAEVSSSIREMMELKFAEYLMNTMPEGSALVIDGTLRRWSDYINTAMQNLDSAARGKNIILTGVAKTTRIKTKEGPSITAAAMALSKSVPYKVWRVKVADIRSETHSANIYVAKLNPISHYAYRVEVNHTKDDENEINRVFNTMAHNVGAPNRYGYPLGLQIADDRARVTEREMDMQKPVLAGYISDEMYERILLDVRSVDMHENLNRIIYGR